MRIRHIWNDWCVLGVFIALVYCHMTTLANENSVESLQIWVPYHKLWFVEKQVTATLGYHIRRVSKWEDKYKGQQWDASQGCQDLQVVSLFPSLIDASVTRQWPLRQPLQLCDCPVQVRVWRFSCKSRDRVTLVHISAGHTQTMHN